MPYRGSFVTSRRRVVFLSKREFYLTEKACMPLEEGRQGIEV